MSIDSAKGEMERSVRVAIHLAICGEATPAEKAGQVADLFLSHQDLLVTIGRNSLQEISRHVKNPERQTTLSPDEIQASAEEDQTLRSLIASFSISGARQALMTAISVAIDPATAQNTSTPADRGLYPLLLLAHDLVSESSSMKIIFEHGRLGLKAFNDYKYVLTATRGKTDAVSVIRVLQETVKRVQDLQAPQSHTEAHRAFHRELYPLYVVAASLGYLSDSNPEIKGIRDAVTKINSKLALDQKDLKAIDAKLDGLFNPVTSDAKNPKKQAAVGAVLFLKQLGVLDDTQIENDKKRVKEQIIRQGVAVAEIINDLEKSLINSAGFLQKSFKNRKAMDQQKDEILAANPVLSAAMDTAERRLKADFEAVQKTGGSGMLSPVFQSPKSRLVFIKESILKEVYGHARAAYMPGTDLIFVPINDETGEVSQEIAENVYHEGRHINSIDFWTADLREAITEGRTIQSARTKDAAKKVWDVTGYKPEILKSAQVFYGAREVSRSGEFVGVTEAQEKQTNRALDIAQFTGNLIQAVH
jgi:hypothetical protein